MIPSILIGSIQWKTKFRKLRMVDPVRILEVDPMEGFFFHWIDLWNFLKMVDPMEDLDGRANAMVDPMNGTRRTTHNNI